MSSSLGEVIKKMAVGANDANAPTSVLFGTVTSVEPLEITVEQKLKLTEEQQNAFEKVAKSIDEKEYKRFLLYGVTGSRKNRSIFTVNTKNTRNARNCNCFSP